jgi:hypothetical protein
MASTLESRPSAAEILAYLPFAAEMLANGIDDPELIDGLTEPTPAERPVSIPRDWEPWLRLFFPRYTQHPFGTHHRAFWEWVWAVEQGKRPPPFIAIWPRGGAKSTSAELALAALAARGVRKYGLYICATQEQADDHVQNVAALLESGVFGEAYPSVASRLLGKYGNSRGWRRNRLRTASGFTLDAIGLDTAARGVKLEEQRPDVEVVDDVDGSEDSPSTTTKKERALTRTLFPAGTDDAAIIGIQNLVHAGGIFARLADRRADYLADRIMSGPLPALEGEAHEVQEGRTVLTAGRPVWKGQDFEACQRIVDRDGISSFLVESQHEVDRFEGGTFANVEFKHCYPDEVPDLVRIVVWTDPAVTDKDSSDSYGIQADGVDAHGTIYRLYSWEQRTSPEDALRRAILKAVELGAEHVGVETDQGGDTWRTVFEKTWRDLLEDPDVPEIHGVIEADPEQGIVAEPATKKPAYRSEKAGAGFGSKAARAQKMVPDYERGRIIHLIGTHDILERALKRFPIRKPYDLTDASFWSWQALTGRRSMRSY